MSRIAVDAVIFGGGIAGLWTLAHLRGLGYSCLLIEARELGAGQTIASQGIIHGGVKYALSGAASAASRAIAEMPDQWRMSLEGRASVDLSRARVLSPHQHLWTTTGIGSRLVGVAASKAIRTPVERVADADRPDWARGAPRGVNIYTVAEPVLDPASLVESLAAPLLGLILRAEDVRFTATGDGHAVGLRRAEGEAAIEARRIVLTAGAGNVELAERARRRNGEPGEPAAMQRRPLHMVMARGRLPAVFGHCLGGGLSDKPRVTITSQMETSGRTVWYIGGAIAEDGVSRSREDQIAASKAELSRCVPWVDLSGTEWATLRVDRAEGRRHDGGVGGGGGGGGGRPDGPVMQDSGGVLCVWPTKLAFAPLVARRVSEWLAGGGVVPGRGAVPEIESVFADWPRPRVAALPWNDAEVEWS
ncbi:MAG: FAD-dependent oxidoreductase [Phycisphaerales bacterium]|nr:FAD-dependent oxidoreductase [Phycisphaerales bacterium]